jgi:hypothetical protein
MEMDRRLLALAGPIGGRITISVVLGLVATACSWHRDSFIAYALATLFSGRDVERAIPWVVAFAAVVVVRGFVVWLSELAAQRTAQGTKAYLREKLLTKLLELGPGYAATRLHVIEHDGEAPRTIVQVSFLLPVPADQPCSPVDVACHRRHR